MRLLRRLIFPTSFIIFVLLAFTPSTTHAVTLLPTCAASGNCGITDILAVLINLAEYALAISGAVALAFFIWGGFQFVLAAGRDSWVKNGKTTLVNATIGIVIILTAGVMVRFVSQALTGQTTGICSEVGAGSNTFTIGGVSNGQPCIPRIGDSCGQNGSNLNGVWVSIPAGTGDSRKPEGLVCMGKTNVTGVAGCDPLNNELRSRNLLPQTRAVQYSCVSTGGSTVLGCARGLCGGGADFACCLCKDASGNPATCSGSNQNP